ncbi:MAG: hypothetical protein KatS3mg057_2271 [Herpetosiphonaceae bacterium]|nr:MAG: hypothetical protein KatS3mg057_2271 [Herpetosiphonaceae bacterium]
MLKFIIIAVILLALAALVWAFLSRRDTTTVGVPHSPRTMESLLNELELLGFYRYTDPNDVIAVKAQAVEIGYLFGWECTQRDYIADAEDLAEGGVKAFLETILAFLQRQGVELHSVQEDYSDQGYTIMVNGKTYAIYSNEEPSGANIWALSTKRTFDLVNHLLAEAGSDERVYLLYGGNDARAIFLTEEMHELIRTSGLLAPEEIPVRTDEIVLR